MSTSDSHADLRKKSQLTEGGVNQFPREDMREILRAWLLEHERSLLAEKNVGEFNGVMMQWFHWYTDDDGNHWNKLKIEAANLAKAGITALWLPPAYKGMNGATDVGYSTYDLFDLGEFDQKGSVRTKYGTKSEYLSAVRECCSYGIEIYADAVFNHKMGADSQEEFEAVPLDDNNRHHALGSARTIRAWKEFSFPGRENKYSKIISSISYHGQDIRRTETTRNRTGNTRKRTEFARKGTKITCVR